MSVDYYQDSQRDGTIGLRLVDPISSNLVFEDKYNRNDSGELESEHSRLCILGTVGYEPSVGGERRNAESWLKPAPVSWIVSPLLRVATVRQILVEKRAK